MQSNKVIWIGTIIVIIFIGWIATSKSDSGPGPLDAFASCLTEKGATYYGAFWCPHCADQKKSFGSSIQYVNYIECSTPDRSGQLQVCKDAGINGYPTWEFSDKSRMEGKIALATLAEKSGCTLPA
jgi:hypothetical protein